MKVSTKVKRNFDFYLQYSDKFSFCGENVVFNNHDENGLSALECFAYFDSQGRVMPCREYDTFVKVIQCKKSINWHIKCGQMDS